MPNAQIAPEQNFNLSAHDSFRNSHNQISLNCLRFKEYRAWTELVDCVTKLPLSISEKLTILEKSLWAICERLSGSAQQKEV